jgi:hypothetical protein
LPHARNPAGLANAGSARLGPADEITLPPWTYHTRVRLPPSQSSFALDDATRGVEQPIESAAWRGRLDVACFPPPQPAATSARTGSTTRAETNLATIQSYAGGRRSDCAR